MVTDYNGDFNYIRKRTYITADELRNLKHAIHLNSAASDLDDAWNKLNYYLNEFKEHGIIDDTWNNSIQCSFSNETDCDIKKFYDKNFISLQIFSIEDNSGKIMLYGLHLIDVDSRTFLDQNSLYFVSITDAIVRFKTQVREEKSKLKYQFNWTRFLFITGNILALTSLAFESMLPLIIFFGIDLFYLIRYVSLFNARNSDVFEEMESYMIKYMIAADKIASEQLTTSADNMDFNQSVEVNRFWDITTLDKILLNAVDKITDNSLLELTLNFYYKLESFTKYTQQNQDILKDYHIREITTHLEDICSLLEDYVELDTINKIKHKKNKEMIATIKKAIKSNIKLVNQLIDTVLDQRVQDMKNKVSVSLSVADEYNIYFKK